MTVFKVKQCSIVMMLLLALSSTNILSAQEANIENELSGFKFPIAMPNSNPWLQAVGETEFTVVWTTNVDAVVWVEVAPDDGTHFYA